MQRGTVAWFGSLLLGMVTLVVSAGPAPAVAQPGPSIPTGPGPVLPTSVPVGSLRVTGSTWNFDGSVPAGSGPFTSVTITNTACNQPPMPGTAQAGLVMFTAELQPTPTPAGITAWQGNLTAVQGSTATGHVRVVTPVTADPISQVDATLYGLGGMAMDNNLTVCLAGATVGPLNTMITEDIQYIEGRTFNVPEFGGTISFQIFNVVSTLGPDGSVFIALAGYRSPSADGMPMWVFFFNGTTFLGEDTLVPSSQLWLSGSPAPGQINVTYANYTPHDPLCCPSLPPVTITYTWNGSTVTPNGTPPGH